MLKKIATAIVAFGALAVATPVFACPHGDKETSNETKTAEKEKPAKDKDTAKKDTKKKDEKKTEKKDDKVSMK